MNATIDTQDMDKERIEELANDPRFIPGIYDYCDRWCERCAFTSRCMTYAMSEEAFDSPASRDVKNEAFWSKLGDIFAATAEMVKEKAKELGIDLDAFDGDETAEPVRHIHDIAREQPCSRAAREYAEIVNDWFEANKWHLERKAEELESLAQADVPGTNPADDAVRIKDDIEVIRWYQHQIYVKLCRAAAGMLRGRFEDREDASEDANGSAKVALIGVERSIAAWAALLPHFSDQERAILRLLSVLQRLLSQIEAAFPAARAFLRPGFDA